MLVDARRAGDEILLLALPLLMGWESQAGATFEGYSIFAGRIQMLQCLEIFLVCFLDVGYGEEVDAHRCMAQPMPVLAM